MLRWRSAGVLTLLVMLSASQSLADDSVNTQLGVYRISPPVVSYTPGTIATGWVSRQVFQATGESILKVNSVECRPKVPQDSLIVSHVENFAIESASGSSTELTAGIAELVNLSFGKKLVKNVTIIFTGDIMELDTTTLDDMRVACLGQRALRPKKGAYRQYFFQVRRLAVGRISYVLDFTDDVGGSLQTRAVQNLAIKLGISNGVMSNDRLTASNVGLIYPYWSEAWGKPGGF